MCATSFAQAIKAYEYIYCDLRVDILKGALNYPGVINAILDKVMHTDKHGLTDGEGGEKESFVYTQ